MDCRCHVGRSLDFLYLLFSIFFHSMVCFHHPLFGNITMKITLAHTCLLVGAIFLLALFDRQVSASGQFETTSITALPSSMVHEMTSRTSHSAENFAQDEAPPPPSPFNPSGPYFDASTPTNVTAQFGKTAYLHCIVPQLGNKTVSWVRHRDLHILTVARYTYISDQRFQAYHLANADDWTLQIRYTQLRDAGLYECQVSTEPKMSLLITLNVVVPKAHIPGAPDKYVKTGSAFTLECVITLCPEPPVYIFWYHENKVINYVTSERSIQVEKLDKDTTVSKLHITNAQPTDSGNYTCTPEDADSTSILVHVLNGQKPAAMQHGKHSASDPLYNQASAILWLGQCLLVLWRIEWLI